MKREPFVRQDRLPSREELAWLRSPEGRATCAAMAGGEPAESPAAIARWRERLLPWQVAAAWGQVVLRSAARAKFSRAEEMLLDRVGLEQATDEVIARHKAKRFAGAGRVVDFCCGIGGDALALAAVSEVAAVDWSAIRLAMAEHNAGVYGHSISGTAADVSFERPEADAAHIDPDRRATGAKRHQPDAGSPGLATLERIVRHYDGVAIKLSPGADFDTLPFDAEIELISHHGDCLQAVAWTGSLQQAHRRATALPAGESIAAGAEESLAWPEAAPVRQGTLLFEPDAAVIRANLVGPLARRHGLAPIDPQIAWLIGDSPVASVLIRPFRVLDVHPWSLAEVRPWLARHDVGRVEIKTRGFAARPEDIHRRLRLTGTRKAVLFLTRTGERPVAILAERQPVDSAGQAPYKHCFWRV